MAHELRTPVTAIYGFARILATDHMEEFTTETREIVAAVERNARRLRILVEQILDERLLSEGKIQLNLAVCRMEDVANEVIAELAGEAAAGNVTLRVLSGTGVPSLSADADRIHQVVYNLTRNAIRFSPASSEIVIVVSRAGDGASVAVTDRGPGVPAEYRQKIFERFFRIPGQNEGSGTGLGLAIVRELALLHGGRAECRDNPGGGAVFCVTLPAVPPARPTPVP